MELKNLAAAKIKATAALPALLRDAPGQRGRYATLAAVLDTVQQPFGQAGIAILEGCHVLDTSVVVECTLYHVSSGETISHQLAIPLTQPTAQAVGSAITYGRRYLLMTMCGIAPEDDDGESATQPPRRQQAPAEPPQAAPAPAPQPNGDSPAVRRAKAAAWALKKGVFVEHNKDGSVNESGSLKHAVNAFRKLEDGHQGASAEELRECWTRVVDVKKLAAMLPDATLPDELYEFTVPSLDNLLSELEQLIWAMEQPEPETTE